MGAGKLSAPHPGALRTARPTSIRKSFMAIALVSVHFIPHTLERHYGDTPLSFAIFARVKL
jgi:hypothetical protein